VGIHFQKVVAGGEEGLLGRVVWVLVHVPRGNVPCSSRCNPALAWRRPAGVRLSEVRDERALGAPRCPCR